MPDMKAIVVHAFGGPEVLTVVTLPVPRCGPNEVLVRVHAAGVGPWDAWIRGGSSAVPQPLPLVPGSDVSGNVEQVGELVEGFTPGDAVFGATNSHFTNGYAQFVPCDSGMIARKPVLLSHVEAASVPVIAVTAWQMLFEHADLYEGQRVLVHGGAGNVGRYAVQFAVSAGVHVQVTPSGRENAWLEELGVHQIASLSEPQPHFDAAIDLVGGDTQRQLFGWLREGGTLVSAVSEPDPEMTAAHRVDARFILVHVNTEELEMIAQLFDRRAIRPWVGEVLPLAEARTAHKMLAGICDHREGKIVLRP